MLEVTLYTNDGSEVVKVPSPPFRIPAEIIVWGERFFVRREDGRYREAMAYFVPPAPLTEDFDPARPIAAKAIDGVVAQ